MSLLRSYTLASPSGGKRQRAFNGTFFDDSTQGPTTGWSVHSCEDDTGPGVDHPLLINHIEKNGVTPLTGSRGAAVPGWFSWYYNYENWLPDYLLGTNLSHIPGTLPSAGAMATEVLARSNPSKPYVSLPNFLYELKDLPGMIRDIGHLKHQVGGLAKGRGPTGGLSGRDLANHQLSVQMGWDPLIGDLRKLMDFQSKVDRKVVDLNNLFVNNGGLHRTIGKEKPSTSSGGGRSGLWTEVLTSSSDVFVESGIGILIQCRLTTTTTRKSWGSTRWNSTLPPDRSYSSDQLASLARSLVFGLNVNQRAIWDAIPWTWMIDWFTNIGSYLDATNNAIPVSASTPCIMTHTRTVTEWKRIDGNTDIKGAEGSTVIESKHRTIAGPTLSAAIPFLNGRQLSILGALAIQRKR